MKTKLTLSVDEAIVTYAHQQARKNGTSISEMFSDYLRRQQLRSKLRQIPTAQAMTGTLSDFTIDDSKAAIRDAYAQKYIR